jgi:peptidoglycan/LPS O-acetylase OafA/YrhL
VITSLPALSGPLPAATEVGRPVAAPSRAARVPTIHIPSLDGLRAVSFFIVFVAHAGLPFVLPVPGGFGVTVFFFLSGFLITTLLRVEQQATGTVSIRHFYFRRALRILPPFYLILALALALTQFGWLPGPADPKAVFAQAGHFANYWFIFQGSDGVPAGTVPYWSLAVEEHFYLVFPLLYLTLNRWFSRPAQGAVLWALCGVVCVWRCILVFGYGVVEDRTYMASDTRFDSILFGCALAVSMNPMLDRPAGGERLWKWGLLPAGLALLLLTFVYRAPWFRETIRYTIQGLALVPVFVTAIRFPDWRPFRLLNMRWVAFIGTLSYTLYLTHQIVLMVFHQQFPGLDATTNAAAALATACLLAYLVHRFVEKPCARLRKRLSGAPSAVPVAIVS